jgi:peptidoglycan/xylan/chitin deacetylase (PgdA/CDA1 family)
LPPTSTPPPATATTRPSPTSTRLPPAATVAPTVGGLPPAEIALGNPARRQIALTFDAGASAEPLPAILAALRQAGVHSTFFLTGAWAKDNPDGVKAIIAGGHEIANHSNTHPDFTTISDKQIVEELQTTEQIIQNIAGRTTKPYFRPPFGARDKRVLAAAWSAGYRSVYWTVDSGDWREDATVDGVVNKVLNNASNGAIFIEHVGSSQTAAGLPRIIAGLREKGYELVPLSVIVQ